MCVFFFKQKTAYEVRISDWSSDVCSSDLEVMTAVRRLLGVLAPAGAVNSLAQLVLKLGAPGVPDTYQGSDLWDLTLVDPDNRRAVNFALRREHLARIEAAAHEDEPATKRLELAAELVASWREGEIKQSVRSEETPS